MLKFHRQLDVTDYVIKWGTSTFNRDHITRKLDAGGLSISLMNPDSDFDTFRNRPDLWSDAQWETWIGVTSQFDGLDYMYPDFVGIIDDMTFDDDVPHVTAEISNIIKTYKEIEIGSQYPYPPYNDLHIYGGASCYRVPLRQDSLYPYDYHFDSKYNIGTITALYKDNIIIPTTQRSSTVTVTSATPGVVTWATSSTNTIPDDGSIVVFTNSGGALPTGLTANKEYYIKRISDTQFTVMASYGGTEVATSSTGTGTHTATFTPYTASLNAPGKVHFGILPSGTITCDFTMKGLLKDDNGVVILRHLMQKEGKLFLNYGIDSTSFTNFQNEVEGSITINNINENNIKLFDFIEKLATQLSASVYLNTSNQDSISLELITKKQTSYFKVAHRNVSELIPGMDSIAQRNPVENVINIIDFTFDSEQVKKYYTFVNRNTMLSYDAGFSDTTATVIDIFGVKTLSKRLTKNIQSSFNVDTNYNYLADTSQIATVTDRNFLLYGNRPPIYEMSGVHPNIFVYNLKDVLYLYQDDDTTLKDAVEITQISKDYDSLTGSITGLAVTYYQFPGGADLIACYAVDDDVFTTYGYTITMTIASPCVVTKTSHGLAEGDTITIKTTGALPTGLTVDTVYYLVNVTTNTFELAATENGTSINTSGTQSGTHKMYLLNPTDVQDTSGYFFAVETEGDVTQSFATT
jgi:hypothetical protein